MKAKKKSKEPKHRSSDPATVERALHAETPPPPSKNLPKLLTLVEVAVYLRVTTKTIRRWRREDSIRAIRLEEGKGLRGSARVLFTEAEVLRFLKRNGHEVPPGGGL